MGGEYLLKPFTLDDADKLKDFHLNQPLKLRVSGFAPVKQRSLAQLNMFWKMCEAVADNSDDEKWNTKYKVAFHTKVALRFCKDDTVSVTPEGNVVFEYRSISFRELKHMEACAFFDRAFEFLAGKIGLTAEELIAEIKHGR